MRRAFLLLACLALAGCYSVQWPWTTTELTTSGLTDNPVKVSTAPAEAWYMIEPAQVSFYSSDIPPEQLAAGGKLNGQVVNVQVIWEPKPGMTPLEPMRLGHPARHGLTQGQLLVTEIKVHLVSPFSPARFAPRCCAALRCCRRRWWSCAC